MNRLVFKTASAAFLPTILLASAFALQFDGSLLPARFVGILDILPYVIFAIAAILGYWFEKSRAVFAVVALTLGAWLLINCMDHGIQHDALGRLAYPLFATLFPINIVAFAFMSERGLFTLAGVSRLSAILLQGLAVLAIVFAPWWLDFGIAGILHQALDTLLHFRLLPSEYDMWTYLPQPALLAFVAAMIVMLGRLAVVGQQPIDTGLLGALITGGIALHMVGRGETTSVFFTTSAIIMTVAIIQDSYRMAFLDELTGLPARRALRTLCQKLGRRYAVAMLDVDHFKKFNDTHGHDVGDQVLRMVASCLDRVGGGGKVFRYGGEEFTVVFPGKTHDQALPHLEKLRAAVEKSSFTLRGKDRPKQRPKNTGAAPKGKGATVSVTISIGVAEKSSDLKNPDAVIKAADEALYRAKKAGRNQVSS